MRVINCALLLRHDVFQILWVKCPLEVAYNAHLPLTQNDRTNEFKDEEARIIRGILLVDVVPTNMERLRDLVSKMNNGSCAHMKATHGSAIPSSVFYRNNDLAQRSQLFFESAAIKE